MTGRLSRHCAGEFLSVLEDLELPLISWGVTSGSLAHDEILDTIAAALAAHQAGHEHEPAAVLQELLRTALVFRVPRSSLPSDPWPKPGVRASSCAPQPSALDKNWCRSNRLNPSSRNRLWGRTDPPAYGPSEKDSARDSSSHAWRRSLSPRRSSSSGLLPVCIRSTPSNP